MPRGRSFSGFDMVLADEIGLTLYRDGKRPSVQGGRFGATEAVRSPGGVEHPVVLDRLDGGMGATERLVPNTYLQAIDGCTRFSRAWTPAGEKIMIGTLPNGSGGRAAGEVRAMYTHGEDLLVGAGGVLYRLSYPYTTPVVEATVDATEEIQDIIEFEGVLVMGTRLIASGLPGRLWVKSAGVWTRSPSVNAQHLVKIYMTINNVGASRLVTNDTRTTFIFVATGGGAITAVTLLDGSAWSGSGGLYPVGESTAPITNLVGAPLVMFFVKTDGVYHVGPDGRAARIADWSDSVHADNGKVAFFAYGGVYASHVRQGLVRVDVANLQVQWQVNACAPGANLPRVSPISGEVTAGTMDGEWIVVPVYNGTDGFVCYGRPNEITERVAMINIASPQSLNWHGSEATFWGQRPTCVEQATIGPAKRPLLWVATMEGATPRLWNVSLAKYGTPLEDWLMGGPHRFTTESWLYYSRQDWGNPNEGRAEGWASVRKVFNRLDLHGEYLERYVAWIDAYMANSEGHAMFWDRALDPDTSPWTQVGRFDETERVSLVPGRSVQSGVKASLMLYGHGERDHPFAFYAAKLRATPLIEQSERRQYRVLVGRVRKANQSQDTRDRQYVLNQIWALQWSDPVNLVDHNGTPLVVQVEPGMSYEDVNDPSTDEPTTAITFTCRILRRPFIWGAGFKWGSDITWS